MHGARAPAGAIGAAVIKPFPRVVASALLHAAEHPVRDICAEEPAVAGASLAQLAPGIAGMAARHLAAGLNQANEKDLREHGGKPFACAGNGSLQAREPHGGPTCRHGSCSKAFTHWTGPLGLLPKLTGRRRRGGRRAFFVARQAVC